MASDKMIFLIALNIYLNVFKLLNFHCFKNVVKFVYFNTIKMSELRTLKYLCISYNLKIPNMIIIRNFFYTVKKRFFFVYI